MLGALIGDIVGSRFEFNNRKSKHFTLFTEECEPTDDSVMSLAVAEAILDCRGKWDELGRHTVERMRAWGSAYPDAGYGAAFGEWLRSPEPQPYNSWGNGSAMRVSACGYAACSLEETKELAHRVTEVTHNHPEGLKGAEATAVCVYMARVGCSKEVIREAVTRDYYPLDFTIDGIRPTYWFNETCRYTVPPALEAFFESTDFEDAIRLAVSVGGDSDTLAAITGAVAEAYYGIPDNLRREAMSYLDDTQREALIRFEARYPVRAWIV